MLYCKSRFKTPTPYLKGQFMTTKFNLDALQDYANLMVADNPSRTEQNKQLLEKWKDSVVYCENERDKLILASMLQNIDNFNAEREKDSPELF
jgi:hypothetical protein